MIKTLAIVSYDSEAGNMYFNQIKKIFAENLNIKKYFIDSDEIRCGVIADLVLIQSVEDFELIKNYIPLSSKILFCTRTISKDGLNKILSIPDGNEVVILDESLELANGIISILFEIGVRNVRLIPASMQIKEILNDKVVVILGESNGIPISPKQVIDIGTCLLDISTIIEIGYRLGLDKVISVEDIWKRYNEVAIPANQGLTKILRKVNEAGSQLDILLHILDDGVIAINDLHQVILYNEAARKIMEVRNEIALSSDGLTQFPQIPFEPAIKNTKSIKDKLIKVNGSEILVSVDPIFNMGKLCGAFAILKNVSESKVQSHRTKNQLIMKGHKAKYNFEDIIGESEPILRCKKNAARMAKSNSTVLITGESGTGKELFAQAIHNSSIRKDHQFVVINCGALPESLLESELFGYEEGAFTGARKGGKPGLFELADKGTLFFDEIGEMPLTLQPRLLRILQERQVMRIGGDRLINIDVRIIAATNRDIKTMVNNGEFRVDLFYRIDVLSLKIPPLNSRAEDIFLLIDKMKNGSNADFILTEKVKKAFLKHDWRGNVRELKNYVENIINLGITKVDIDDLPFEIEASIENRIVKDDEEKSSDAMIAVAGKDINSYIFILEQLHKAIGDNKRLGRRSVFKKCEENNLFISEKEIRNILLNLENNQMVKILKGRGGTMITKQGIEFLNNLE